MMRALFVAFATMGTVFGLAAAVALHSLPAVLVGEGYSWFAYTASDSLAAGSSVSIYLQWTPSLLTLGALGLLGGLLVAAVLGRLGWQLTRPPR